VSLLDALGKLPDRERLMMRLYYEEDLNLREIGEVLGVSESRVCQLHKQAVFRLRAMLGEEGVRLRAPRRQSAPQAPIKPLCGHTHALDLGLNRRNLPAGNQPVFHAVVG
ncbi:MAG: hypothetical protein RIR70_1170, partial [Pseudomonadota bacterium]